jgi:hypothetical protein
MKSCVDRVPSTCPVPFTVTLNDAGLLEEMIPKVPPVWKKLVAQETLGGVSVNEIGVADDVVAVKAIVVTPPTNDKLVLGAVGLIVSAPPPVLPPAPLDPTV